LCYHHLETIAPSHRHHRHHQTLDPSLVHKGASPGWAVEFTFPTATTTTTATQAHPTINLVRGRISPPSIIHWHINLRQLSPTLSAGGSLPCLVINITCLLTLHEAHPVLGYAFYYLRCSLLGGWVYFRYLPSLQGSPE
jgi:hypothetical protein